MSTTTTPTVDAQRASWDALAKAWEEHADTLYAWRQPLHAQLAEQLGAEAPARGAFLDLACGPGEPSVTVARRWPETRVVGADISGAMVDAAARRGRALPNFEARRFEGDPRALGETFDGATCCFGVEYVPDPRGFFEAVAAVMRPGAPLLVVSWGPREGNAYHTVFIDALAEVFGATYGAEQVFRIADGVEALLARASEGLFRMETPRTYTSEMRFADAAGYVALRRAIAPGAFARSANDWTPEQRRALHDAIGARVAPGPDGTLRFTCAARVFTLRRGP